MTTFHHPIRYLRLAATLQSDHANVHAMENRTLAEAEREWWAVREPVALTIAAGRTTTLYLANTHVDDEIMVDRITVSGTSAAIWRIYASLDHATMVAGLQNVYVAQNHLLGSATHGLGAVIEGGNNGTDSQLALVAGGNFYLPVMTLAGETFVWELEGLLILPENDVDVGNIAIDCEPLANGQFSSQVIFWQC